MKLRLFQILENLISRKGKRLRYSPSWSNINKPVNMEEKEETQTKLI